MPKVSSEAYSNLIPQEKSYFTFVAGLNTDASPLSFPDNFSSDEENFVLNIDGSRERRLGLMLEEGGNVVTLAGAADGVMRAHHWRNVSGDPNTNFVVLQAGKYLLIFNDAMTITGSGAAVGSIDLTAYKLGSATEQQVRETYVSTDYGRGNLFVVSKYIEPFYVSYSATTTTFTVDTIRIQERDFEGVDDGVGNTTKPTILTDEHLYNLKNGGWTKTIIDVFFGSKAYYPSKNMIPWMGQARETTTDVAEQDWTKTFSPDKLVAELFQDVPAPIGSLIKDAHDSRIVVGGDTASYPISTWRLADYDGGSTTAYIRTQSAHGLSTTDDVVIDGHSYLYQASVGSWPEPDIIDTTWSLDGTHEVTVPVANISAATAANPIVFTTSAAHNMLTGDSVTFASLPGDFGTNLNSNTYSITKVSDTTFSVAVNGSGYTAYTSGGTATAANWFTTTVTFPSNVHELGYTVSNGTLWTANSALASGAEIARRPTSVAFFAGRVWYAGTQANKLSHKVYYSQIIENDAQYGKCYQVADPTSEYISDLVASDGGVIAIPEMDTVRELIAYNGKLLVMADNGIWEIGGGDRGYFTATGYSVRQLANVGCTSPAGVVIGNGTPFFMSDGAIYAIQQDPNFGFLFAQDITTGKIQKLLSTIPKTQKEVVQASFDRNSGKVYWLYKTGTTVDWTYSNWLVYDTRIQSFSKFSNKGAYKLQAIHDIEDYQDDTAEERNIKFICSNTATDSIYFSELADDTFEDFGVDAQAYVETGNDGLGDITRRRHGRYLFTYMRRTERGYTGAEGSEATDLSSCLVQYLWNWADSSTTGAWSTPYQVYRRWMRKYRNPLVADMMGEPVVTSKSKIRGSGKVLRLRFQTEANKNCHIYGWHLRQDIGAEA